MQFIWFTREPDLIVEIEDEQNSQTYLFLVACVPLRLASPVWDRMLKPNNGFKPLPETMINGMSMRVLKLYDDDISSLGWIFNIIHFQTDQVPKELSYENLLAVTILCDKYNLQNAVTPWAEGWIKFLLPDTTETWRVEGDAFKYGIEDWLFIAHTFPRVKRSAHLSPKILNQMVDEIVGEMDDISTKIREPKSFGGEAITVYFDLTPACIFTEVPDHIKNTRQKIFDEAMPRLKHLLVAIYNYEENLERSPIGPIDTRIKTCQGCYDVSLVSSIGASLHGDYEIEATYCEPCIRREIPVWRLQKRIDALEILERTHSWTIAARIPGDNPRVIEHGRPSLRASLGIRHFRT
ncbi:hypothetical protein ABW21_db0207147 [Orbilia brochopaga]|nr:hypothetical protein ABW21_db0207147 [Drechslerella brochopaga]